MDDLLSPLVPSFERSLRARRRSPKTIASYRDAARLFIAHQAASGAPLAPGLVTRGHVEDFISAQLAAWTPSTAATRFRCLQQFFNWLVDEGEAPASPMAKMAPPTLDAPVVPILSDADLRALLRGCDGRGFADRRDSAIMRLFIATGIRRAEMAGITVADLHLDDQTVLVTGKGDRARWVSFGDNTAVALDRYDRERRRHRLATHPALWLAPKGGLTDSGVAQIVRRRARAAGLGEVHPHQFRHTFAHRWLAAGGTEGDLQELAGWRSSQMVARYGASARSERARAAYQRIDFDL